MHFSYVLQRNVNNHPCEDEKTKYEIHDDNDIHEIC